MRIFLSLYFLAFISFRSSCELITKGVILTSEGVGTQNHIQCALDQPEKWTTEKVELTLTSAKDNSSYIQCGHDVEEDTTCTLKGVIPHVPDTDPKSLNIARPFSGSESYEYTCSVTVGTVTVIKKIYAELIEVGMYFTEAHHQGVVYLTETVSRVFCAYYNGIMYPRTKTEIQICDVAQYQDAEVGGTLIPQKCPHNKDVTITCRFTANVGNNNLSVVTSTQHVKIFPKCNRGEVINEGGACQKCETGYRNYTEESSQYKGCQACVGRGMAPNTSKDGCIECNNSLNEVSRAGMSCETCPNGTEANQSTQSCDVCSAGKKAADKEHCTECPKGTYSSVSGSSVCTACSPGHYQDTAGQNHCKACPVGCHQSEDSQEECLECPSGQFSDKIASPTCTICPPGTFQGLKGQASCTQCPAGHYQPSASTSVCLECDITKGQYQPTEGSTWCWVTQPGHQLIPGSPGTLPKDCQSGVNGSNYRGTIDVTENGMKCQKWNVSVDSNFSDVNEDVKAVYPDKGLGEHNYCRNPDGLPRLWCYITNSTDKRWGYCDVPQCEGANSSDPVKQCGYNEYSAGATGACTACDTDSKEYSRYNGSTYCEVCSTELNEGYPFCHIVGPSSSESKCLESSVTSKVLNASGETYTFKETLVGGIASVPCNSNPDKQEYITRYCKMGSTVRTKWSSPDFSQCTTKFSAQLRSSLNWNVSSVKEGAKVMHNICKGARLLPSDIVQVGKSLLAFNKDNIDGDMDTIRNVANTVALLVSNSNKDSLATCDNTDKVSILATMDMLVDSMASGSSLIAGSMALSVITGGAALPATENMTDSDVPKLNINSSLEVAVVVFSPEAASLFPAPTAEESNDGTAQVNKSLESSIVSLKVTGDFSSFKLELSSDSSGDEEKHGSGKAFERTCQFLDTTDNTWSTEGCITTALESGKYQCECTHNTSFAILLSVSEIKDTSQDTASTVMGAFNLVFLTLTFLSLAPFKKFRQRQLMQIQINLVLSLILANVGFIILSYTASVTVNEMGEPVMSLNVGCISGTVIVQWLFLSVMAWMTCAAYTLYGKIVDALKTYGKTDRFYLLKCSLGCWVFPSILPIAACVTSYSMNDSQGEYNAPYVGANANFENGTSCWVDAPWKWVSFFLPCWSCLLVNFIMIAMIARVIIRSAKSGSSAGGNHAREIKALLTIAFTVGVPWVFAALTIGAIAQVFQWLFIIVTGLQGLGMFVCFVIFQEDVLTNLCSLVGQSPPAFLMTPKTRSPKELTTAKSTTGVTRVEKDDLEEDEEEDEVEAAIEFKEGDDMTQNIYSNAKAIEETEDNEEDDGRKPELV